MPTHKVNKSQPTPGPTWEEVGKMFLYLDLMWKDTKKPGRLFGQLAKACQEIAAGK